MTIGLFEEYHVSNAVHALLISLAQCFDVQLVLSKNAGVPLLGIPQSE